MKLLVKRLYKKNEYTIGKLYVDGVYFCDTLEDKDRGLRQSDALSDLKRLKNPGKTAIPTGTYDVSLRVYSNKFGGQQYYKELCKGLLPRILSVPAFDGVLIHAGNTADDTEGCLLVGQNKAKGQVLNSKETFTKLYLKLKSSLSNITITFE